MGSRHRACTARSSGYLDNRGRGASARSTPARRRSRPVCPSPAPPTPSDGARRRRAPKCRRSRPPVVHGHESALVPRAPTPTTPPRRRWQFWSARIRTRGPAHAPWPRPAPLGAPAADGMAIGPVADLGDSLPPAAGIGAGQSLDKLGRPVDLRSCARWGAAGPLRRVGRGRAAEPGGRGWAAAPGGRGRAAEPGGA